MNKKPAIHAQELTKRFGDFTAVDHISFDVQRGEIFGFLGPNGSGKTTSIRMMLGLLTPSDGHVEVAGIPVATNPSAIRPRIGYMSQRFSLYNDLTVLENLRFYGRSYGLVNQHLEQRIQEAIHSSGLSGRERTLTRDLSGGWRQRLSLSAAILHRPELVFLDEPTAGVDPVSRRAFWDLLYELAESGITVFITTHYMDEAEHCHRLALIQRGRIIAQGTPQTIKANLLDAPVLEIQTPRPEAALLALREAGNSGQVPLRDASLFGSCIHAIGATPSFGIDRVRATLSSRNIPIDAIEPIEPSLEDVFIACMRDSQHASSES